MRPVRPHSPKQLQTFSDYFLHDLSESGRGDEMAALCDSQIELGPLSEALANWCTELQMLQQAANDIETLIKLKKGCSFFQLSIH